MTPIEITSGTLAVANGIFTLTTNFWKLRSVDGDLEVCLRLLEMITKDLNYARKLRIRKYLRGRKPDASLARVESAIEDLDTAAKQIGKSIEASRVEKALHKSISIVTRFAWVYNGKDNFIAQQWAVQAAQTRVLHVITSMEAMPDIQEKPVAPPTYEEALLRSPSQLRALKGKNLSIIRAKGDHSKVSTSTTKLTTSMEQQLVPSQSELSSSPSSSQWTTMGQIAEDNTIDAKILAPWERRRNA